MPELAEPFAAPSRKPQPQPAFASSLLVRKAMGIRRERCTLAHECSNGTQFACVYTAAGLPSAMQHAETRKNRLLFQ